MRVKFLIQIRNSNNEFLSSVQKHVLLETIISAVHSFILSLIYLISKIKKFHGDKFKL